MTDLVYYRVLSDEATLTTDLTLQGDALAPGTGDFTFVRIGVPLADLNNVFITHNYYGLMFPFDAPIQGAISNVEVLRTSTSDAETLTTVDLAGSSATSDVSTLVGFTRAALDLGSNADGSSIPSSAILGSATSISSARSFADMISEVNAESNLFYRNTFKNDAVDAGKWDSESNKLSLSSNDTVTFLTIFNVSQSVNYTVSGAAAGTELIYYDSNQVKQTLPASSYSSAVSTTVKYAVQLVAV